MPAAVITPAGPVSTCENAVVLNANAGTGYTYQWKKADVNISGANNINYTAVENGAYTVAVSANGCTKVSDAIIARINEPSGVTFNISNYPTITGPLNVATGDFNEDGNIVTLRPSTSFNSRGIR